MDFSQFWFLFSMNIFSCPSSSRPTLLNHWLTELKCRSVRSLNCSWDAAWLFWQWMKQSMINQGRPRAARAAKKCSRVRGVRYQNWFNLMFEFRQKVIKFNIQFNTISLKFNSNNYSIQKDYWWFNSIANSIQMSGNH